MLWKDNPKKYMREYMREYRKKNPEKMREYEKGYMREYKDKNPKFVEKQTKYKSKWKKNNPNFVEKQRENMRKYHLNNLEKYKAHRIAQKIKIPKGQLCEVCKEMLAIERHHKDYSKPLEFIFVCRRCHSKISKGVIKW